MNPASAAARRIVFLLLMAAAAACSGPAEQAKPAETPAAAPAAAAPEAEPTPAPLPDAAAEDLPPLPFETGLPDDLRARLGEATTGDLDEMIKRRRIRVGVTFNRTHYFVDRGVQRGIAYDFGRQYEDELNKARNTGHLKVHVVFVPLPRDLLLQGLVNGRVDVVAAQLTDTPERRTLVDFSTPTRRNVSEVVVTGPGAPAIAGSGDLAGQTVHVRKSSNYHTSLVALNKTLTAQGKAPVVIKPVPENLEDDDVLEMVNAGLIGITVVDDYLANFWKQVFPNLTVHPDVALATGGNIAAAFRKNSPQLAASLNAFLATHGTGTLFGNMVEKRYLRSTKYAADATSEAERKKLLELVELFRKYAGRYQLDYVLMAAQGFQESRLDQNVKSPVGAIGVMQVMPATGKDLNVGDIQQLEPNIHAGVKYMRFMMDQYFKDEPMDQLNKGLFTFASYNAGPARIRQLRREAEKRGLDPNVWFGNVERIASERIGRETVTYVSNIFKYYVAYRLVLEERERRQGARKAVQGSN